MDGEPSTKRLKLSDNGIRSPGSVSRGETIADHRSGMRQQCSSASVNPTPNHRPLEKVKTEHGSPVSHKILTMQRILVSVLHARSCRAACQDPCCAPMKRVLAHLAGCADGKSCFVAHCRSTRQIVEHFTNCQVSNCPVCRVVRTDSQQTDSANMCSNAGAKVSTVSNGSHSPAKLRQSPSEQAASSAQSSCSDPKKPAQKLYSVDELREKLMPTWSAVYEMYPHSMPFRQPVDPVLEQIPDYPVIVKNPMDLSTICRKLQDGEYCDPWEYIDDMQLMFSNAWLYNRRSTPIYKSCTKLAEKFESIIDDPMKSLGCCCGQKPRYRPMPLYCFSSSACYIPVNAVYYIYEDKYVFCEKCFASSHSDVMEVVDNPTRPPMLLQKEQFARVINSTLEPEPFVTCSSCGRRQHQVCVEHIDEVWTAGYVCDECLRRSQRTRPVNPFTADKLTRTTLGNHLESRVNSFLSERGAADAQITVRVLACTSRATEVKPFMRRRFPDAPGSFPYTAKGIFAFQKSDGKDICFFGLHVQEYGSDTPQPNHRRVYLAYLDSINLFRPSNLRTLVYQQLLIGYFEHIRSLGFMYVHIWACPPAEGDDYIFHRHPADQKIPKPKRLQDWYRRLLDEAVSEGAVSDYKDIAADALMARLATAKDVPYFDGDFWPNTLEEAIAEEEKEKDIEESVDSDDVIVDVEDCCKPQSKAGKAKKSKKSCKGRKPGVRKGMAATLIDKVLTTMDKHREMFFIVHLCGSGTTSSDLPPTRDPDPHIGGELADGRGALLIFCRERRLEFSTLRRATFSSMVIVHELHVEQSSSSAARFIRCCGRCQAKSSFSYICTTCQNVEMCSSCYEELGHEHAMRRCVAEVESSATENAGDSSGDVIQRCIETVAHAASCTRGALCTRQPECRKMLDVLSHARACALGASCTVCQQLMALCVTHARSCTVDAAVCHVPFCAELRKHIQRRQTLQRYQQRQIDDRRRAVMSGTNMTRDEITDDVETHCGNGTSGKSCRGKGKDVLSTVTHTKTPTMTADLTHEISTNAVHISDDCSKFTSMTEGSVPLNHSTLQVNGDSSGRPVSSVNSVPQTDASRIDRSDDKIVKSQFTNGSGTVVSSMGSSARHQVVVGCLRVLKKLNTSIPKQNLLQMLCHCSRQQLTALQDKLKEAGLWNSTAPVARSLSSCNGTDCTVANQQSPRKQSPRRSGLGRHIHHNGYQQLMDIINLPNRCTTTGNLSSVLKTSNGQPQTAVSGVVASPLVCSKSSPLAVQTDTNGPQANEPLRPTDVLVQFVDNL